MQQPHAVTNASAPPPATSSFPTVSLKLYYKGPSDGSYSFLQYIDSSTTNTQSYTWTFPSYLSVAGTYKVAVATNYGTTYSNATNLLPVYVPVNDEGLLRKLLS